MCAQHLDMNTAQVLCLAPNQLQSRVFVCKTFAQLITERNEKLSFHCVNLLREKKQFGQFFIFAQMAQICTNLVVCDAEICGILRKSCSASCAKVRKNCFFENPTTAANFDFNMAKVSCSAMNATTVV